MDGVKLIGRATEQAALQAALEKTRARSGSLVLVAGEAGIGKTRLVEGVLHGSALRVLRGPSRDVRTTVPYAPLAAVLRAHLNVFPNFLNEYPLRDHLALLLPELGLAAPEAGTPPLFQEALVGALGAAAQCEPLVVVLEDLHWADHATLEFLPLLAAALPSLPLLVVGTYRRDDLPRLHPMRRTRLELRRAAHLEELNMVPLPERDCIALAADQAGAPLSPALAALVYTRSEGVPLFVQEFLGALRANNRLERNTAGELTLRAGAEMAVPLTLRDAVLLGLDRLSAGARGAAEAASVMGQTFDAGMLLELIGDDVVFDTLTEGGLLVEARGQVTFRHALVRDAIYAGIPWARRRTLHRWAGTALAKAGAAPATLAEHWLAGHEPELARQALLASSLASCRLHAYRDAADAAGHALDLWPPGVDEAGRLDVLDQLGRCAQACGLLPEASRAWREAAQARWEAGDLRGSAEAQRRLAGALELQGLWEQALEARQRSAERFDAAFLPGPAAEERLTVGSTLRAISRNTSALDLLARALADARRAGRRDLEARALAQSGNALVRAGQIEVGLRTGHMGLSIALDGNHTVATVEALQRLADSLEHSGDYAGARSAYIDAIAACEAGDLPDFACRACLAVPMYQNGDWTRATAECRSVLGSPAAAVTPRAVAGAMLGTVLAHQGQPGRARPVLHEALALAQRLGLVPVQLRALWGLALIEDPADPPAAAVWIDTLLEVWEAAEDHYHVLFPMRWAASFHAQRQDESALRRTVSTLNRAADLNGCALALSALAHALGELAWLAGDVPASARQFEVAVALLRDTHTPFEEASTRLRAGQVLAALNRREEAVEHLSWAHRTASSLRVMTLTARAAQLLHALGEPAQQRGTRSPGSGEFAITRRQLEVLRLAAAGLTDKAIAQQLRLSPRTVEMHMGHLLASLNSRSRTEAVGKASALGLLVQLEDSKGAN